MKWDFKEAPPPNQPPVYPESAALGLCEALQVSKSRDTYRCGKCNELQYGKGTDQVWVPDIFEWRMPKDEREVLEVCRQQAYNGSSCAWCVKCAKLLGNSSTSPISFSFKPPFIYNVKLKVEEKKNKIKTILLYIVFIFLYVLAIGVIGKLTPNLPWKGTSYLDDVLLKSDSPLCIGNEFFASIHHTSYWFQVTFFSLLVLVTSFLPPMFIGGWLADKTKWTTYLVVIPVLLISTACLTGVIVWLVEGNPLRAFVTGSFNHIHWPCSEGY